MSLKFIRHVERLILDNGGVIYGGYVRDAILREHEVEAEFYPDDIDCYMNNHMLHKFFFDIKNYDTSVSVIFDRADVTHYIPNMNIPYGVIRHMRCVVASPRGSYKISLDIMYTNCLDFHAYTPPFGGVDFECDGLLLTKSGITLSPCVSKDYSLLARQKKLDVILDDIRKRTAVYVDLAPHRIQKMLEKGWTVGMRYIEKADDKNETCIICHEYLDSTDHCKLMCCNARYHHQCLVKALDSDNMYCMAATGQCIMCKQDTRAYEEVAILRAQKMI